MFEAGKRNSIAQKHCLMLKRHDSQLTKGVGSGRAILKEFKSECNVWVSLEFWKNVVVKE
jgi:hypothetical protein